MTKEEIKINKELDKLFDKVDEGIIEFYIPYLVKNVLAKEKPVTEEDFIQFSQALYSSIIARKTKIWSERKTDK